MTLIVLHNSLDARSRDFLVGVPPGIKVLDWYQGGAEQAAMLEVSAFPSVLHLLEDGEFAITRLPLDWAEVLAHDAELRAGLDNRNQNERERAKRLLEACTAEDDEHCENCLNAAGVDSVAAILGLPPGQLQDRAGLLSAARELALKVGYSPVTIDRSLSSHGIGA